MRKLSLCFNGAPRHEGVLVEWRCNFTHSLTSALDGGEWSDSGPSRFTPRERAPGTHWKGGWAGPRAVLEAVVKTKIPSPRRKSIPRTSIVQPIAQRCTDWAITALRERDLRLWKMLQWRLQLSVTHKHKLTLQHRIYKDRSTVVRCRQRNCMGNINWRFIFLKIHKLTDDPDLSQATSWHKHMSWQVHLKEPDDNFWRITK
jgi:hypothetical protein